MFRKNTRRKPGKKVYTVFKENGEVVRCLGPSLLSKARGQLTFWGYRRRDGEMSIYEKQYTRRDIRSRGITVTVISIAELVDDKPKGHAAAPGLRILPNQGAQRFYSF